MTVPGATEAGDWSPTPPAFLPFGTAWLGGVRPLALNSTTQFAPGPPPRINSAKYLKEFEEVRDLGEINSVDRDDDQTQTAKFFSDAGIVPMQAALRELATRRALDIDDSARMFAAVDTAIADGAGTVWNAKLKYMWWRPVTAIQMADSDGNDDTAGIPGWTSLITNPPYPEWPSGLCSVVGAVSTALSRLNTDGKVDLNISSAAAGETRHYRTRSEINREAVDARVWSGIHFRTAD